MMQQASVCGLSFDPFTSHEDRVALPEVDIRRAKVADALVVASAMALGHDKAATSASRKKLRTASVLSGIYLVTVRTETVATPL